MGEQHVKLEIGENNLVTKVGHDMGGSYEYTTTIDGESYDDCVMCKSTTQYKTSTHIDFRVGYVEGVGQLCTECYEAGSSNGREMIMIPKSLIKNHPNDAELGYLVRSYFHKNY